MASITAEQVIENICGLCNIRREDPDMGRVFSKKELMIVQSVLLRQQNDLKKVSSQEDFIKSIVEETLHKLKEM